VTHWPEPLQMAAPQVAAGCRRSRRGRTACPSTTARTGSGRSSSRSARRGRCRRCRRSRRGAAVFARARGRADRDALAGGRADLVRGAGSAAVAAGVGAARDAVLRAVAALAGAADAAAVTRSCAGRQAEQWPVPSQVSPWEHVPHEPWQPLSPHCLPLQLGVHSPHAPPESQTCPDAQVPHVPPQPSGPHVLPEQCGKHWLQVPFWQAVCRLRRLRSRSRRRRRRGSRCPSSTRRRGSSRSS